MATKTFFYFLNIEPAAPLNPTFLGVMFKETLSITLA